jgi:Fe-S cluster biogenesis protein NfuA
VDPANTPDSPVTHVREAILKLCREVLGPLVHSDGGQMFLVSATADAVHLHLSGACSGCPGVSFTRDEIILPLVQGAAPKARLTVTTGIHPPAGAAKIE